ncbi:MAG: acetate--CoA ligase family protein [Bacillota bacterium]|nr:acetate--CoA ligase family protein [Bacillota bacterium]MDW7683714.1 acetate--CoA ligase family protein [Bacillota bacterium]
MKNNPLNQLMNPKSIATVGAGNNPSKMGTLHALSILKGGFQGKFYPLHRNETHVLGHTAYKSAEELPEVPELVMLIVPTEHVLQLLEDFGRIGTKHAIIVSAGFRETGTEGRKKEEQLKEITARYGIRFLGPNCIGMINSQKALNTTVMPGTGKPGKLGIASQSGTYITQTLSYLKKKGIHFSKAISVGNEVDIDIIDALEYLGEDEQTKAIALYIEGIRDGQRFIEVARKVTRHKPVIAQYVGGSGAGARAGMSHTGSMAGPDFLYEGIFRQAGIIRVGSVEDLYGHGWTLATQPALQGNRVAVVTNSGGPGTAISDTCEKNGLEVPQFSEKLQAEIRKHIQSHASSANPVDLTFHLDAQVLTNVIPKLIMESGEVDGIVLHGGMSHGFMKDIYPHLRELLGGITMEQFLALYQSDLTETVSLPQKYAKPLIASSFFGREDNYTTAYLDNEISVFDAPEKAARAMAALYKYQSLRNRKESVPAVLPAQVEQAADIIRNAITGGQKNLDEHQSKQLLAAYGIPVTKEERASGEDAAVRAAASIGYPVVLKGLSADIAHKTEKGLVHLNLKTEEEVRQAWLAITDTAEGGTDVLVSEMIGGNRELMAGMVRYPGFGPCIMFGLGGIYTEAIRDVTFRAAPLGETEAEEMVADIRGKKILGAFRGMPAVELSALTGLLQKLSFIGVLHPEIAEIDINPLIISGSKPVAVDALVVLSQPEKKVDA